MTLAFALMLALELTFAEIVADIPHDGRSVIVYSVLAIFAGMIWLGSRQRPPAELPERE